MKIFSERDSVKDGIQKFIDRYSKLDTFSGHRKIPELEKLNPEKASAKDVADIIGNISWAGPFRCHECNLYTFDLVQLGEEPDYESNTANVCIDCLMKAVTLIKTHQKPLQAP